MTQHNVTIYTLGYTGWKLDDVLAVVERLDAVLVDVRMVPRSRNPIWNSGALAKGLGSRYVWLREFGNRNYKGTFDQIEIVDFSSGLQRLLEMFPPEDGRGAPGKPLILFCGCPDASQCHRSVLAELMFRAFQAAVHHLPLPFINSRPALF